MTLVPSRRRAWIVVAAAVIMVLAGAGPAGAAEPAGTGLDIAGVSVSGPVLTWSGIYSCTGVLLGALSVTAADNAGRQGSAVVAVSCPATGTPVGGSVSSGLLGLGGDWGSRITLRATGGGLLSGIDLSDQVTIDNGALDTVTVDGATIDGSGDQLLNGSFSCDVPGTVTLTMSATEPSTGASGSADVALACPPAGTNAPWRAAVPGGYSYGNIHDDITLAGAANDTAAGTDGETIVFLVVIAECVGVG